MTNFIKLIFYSIIYLLIVNCSTKSNIEYKNWQGGLILTPGKYYIDSSFVIEVDTEDNLVSYFALDKGDTVIKSEYKASSYQNWSLFFDKNNHHLWFNSSDIGGAVWKISRDKKYKPAVFFNRNDLYKEMPEEFFETLSGVTKDKYRYLRKN